MKTFIFLSLSMISFVSHGGTKYRSPLYCSGEAQIQGAIFLKRVDFEVRLNSLPGPYGGVGHIAVLDGRTFSHPDDLAKCEQVSTGIVSCKGFGLGNGPKLKVVVDLTRLEASGSYFNPRGLNMNYENESNTYVFEHLSCTKGLRP